MPQGENRPGIRPLLCLLPRLLLLPALLQVFTLQTLRQLLRRRPALLQVLMLQMLRQLPGRRPALLCVLALQTLPARQLLRRLLTALCAP